ncbi:MAG: hypothetical protein ACKO6N_11850 [Myxococcota bacterium]
MLRHPLMNLMVLGLACLCGCLPPRVETDTGHAPGNHADPLTPVPVTQDSAPKTPKPSKPSPWKESALPSSVSRVAYTQQSIKRLALVPLKDFSPANGARVPLEEPLTADLIQRLRSEAGLDVQPGFIPNARSFIAAMRAHVAGTRGARFPARDFEQLRDSVPSQAYLVYWIEHSRRPLFESPNREMVAALRYELETVAVLLDPEGRIFWRVSFSEEVALKNGHETEGYAALASRAMERLLFALRYGEPPEGH